MHEPLVDFHCHLDLYRDPDAAFKKCRGEKIELLAVTTTPRAWRKNLEFAGGAPNIRIALGLHPQLVAEGVDEFALFEKHLVETIYVGEVGLDAGPRFYCAFDKQKEAFEKVLRSCSEQGGKILSIHSVRCGSVVLKMLETFLPQDRGIAVLHWFSGSISEAKRAVQLGCYFSINPEMLKSDPGRKLITSLPFERILTETDGPFTMTAGRPSLPSDIASSLGALSKLLRLELEETKTLIIQNLRRLEAQTSGEKN